MGNAGRMRCVAESGPGAGTEFEIGTSHLIIGSDPDCDVTLSDNDAAGEHASIKEVNGRVEVHDLGSGTGTFVNGTKIAAPTVLGSGDEVKIGSTTFRVLPAAAAAPPPSPPAAAGTTGAPGGPGEPGRAEAGWREHKRGVAIAAALLLVAIAVAAYVLTRGEDPLSASEVDAQDQPSTVMVVARSRGFSPVTGTSGGIFSAGTGWVWDAEQGLIVTAAHVVTSGSAFQVGFDQTGLRKATIVGVDVPDDLAVLRVSPADLPGLRTMERAAAEDVKQGDTVYALGYPGNSTSATDFLGTPFQATEGTISATTDVQTPVDTDILGFPNNQNAELLLTDLFQTTAALNSGNSGGPLVDVYGDLVGSNVAGGGGEAQGYAVKVSTIDDAVPGLAEGDSVGWMGFGVNAISSAAADSLLGFESGPSGVTATNVEGGLLVTSVVRDTPADQAGLGDILAKFARRGQLLLITAVNNQPVTTMEQYVNAVSQLESGEQADLDLSCIFPREGICVPIPSVKMRVP